MGPEFSTGDSAPLSEGVKCRGIAWKNAAATDLGAKPEAAVLREWHAFAKYERLPSCPSTAFDLLRRLSLFSP